MKLIALDLDGTLLSSDHKISAANLNAIKKAEENGHIVSICSGRPPESIEELMSEYNLNVPYAASNGTAVKAGDDITYLASIDRHTVDQLVAILNKNRIFFRVYTDKGVYVPANFKELLHNDEILLERIVKGTKVWEEEKETVLVQKLFVLFFDDAKRTELKEVFSSSFPSIKITSSGDDNLELNDRNGHKGNGLKALAKAYGISIEDTVAIGDNHNDRSMFEAAGLSIAMGNAEDEIKKICDAVTVTNDEDGVAYAIEKLILA